ncbi:TetR/AcrR family transcriptional regulator [Subtercola endophyticus]|uniref:TetR/AcrR family transcriptional regulator n=1 Tax=Subtercola endophyticus TaxID=2895559 RepID=UPI001E4DA257|nr:TetR/AcrR family transcriptional regulator [Subtercola endophyticus]UFS60918.1 TetR/AcrR family transcriptional regulator; helix-turn-helix transcriptional regulator [Subtercola endophyticus]
MDEATSQPTRVRADAQRNRERLIEAARRALSAAPGGEASAGANGVTGAAGVTGVSAAAGAAPGAASGAVAPVSLEAIARDAGVGIGTLYRHFPTRDALVEAVYRTELETVLARGAELLASTEPAEALRQWMLAYADFVSTKRGMAESLRSLLQTGAITSSQTRARVTETIAALLDAGARAGTLRPDVRADDVAASLVGVFLATPHPGQRPQADRMLALLLAGIRAPAVEHAS